MHRAFSLKALTAAFVWVSMVKWWLLHNWSPHRSRSNHSYWASSLNVNKYLGCSIFAFLLGDNDLYTMCSLLTCIYLRNFTFRQSQMLCICPTFPLSYLALCIACIVRLCVNVFLCVFFCIQCVPSKISCTCRFFFFFAIAFSASLSKPNLARKFQCTAHSWENGHVSFDCTYIKRKCIAFAHLK